MFSQAFRRVKTFPEFVKEKKIVLFYLFLLMTILHEIHLYIG